MPFIYQRAVRFQDTDAAGVVYFANVLAMCHEAYEESLARSGVNLKSFFSNSAVAVPIVHANVDFFRPIYCGDRLTIHLLPIEVTSNTFEVAYQVFATTEKLVAKAITKHVCIDSVNRVRQELPEEIVGWLRELRKE